MIERDWVHSELRCVMLLNPSTACRCGYVGVTKDHPLHGVGYSDRVPVLTKALARRLEQPIGNAGVIPMVLAACSDDDDAGTSPDVALRVHGGITYAEGRATYPIENDGLWWFGFDCGHYGDAPDLVAADEAGLATDHIKRYIMSRGGTVRTSEYVITECEQLADQLIQIAKEATTND